MPGIFISYRRDDAQGEALHLFDNLKQHFGADRVFMDVIAIRPGEDYRKVIDSAVASCDVLITLIGRDWLQRLTGARDFVRLETAAALKRDVRVIPVLVQGATMPTEEALPDDLKPLAYRNAIELSHSRWDYDVRMLIEALERVLSSMPSSLSLPSAALATLTPRRSIARMAAAGAMAALLLAGGAYWFWTPSDPPNQQPSKPEPANAGPAASEPPQPEPKRADTPKPDPARREPPTKTNPPPSVSTSVPALLGLKEADARDALQRAGLVVGTRMTTKRGDVEPGTVLGHSPKAGESVEKGFGVTINVAVADLRSVPNVVGKTNDAASEALRAEHLKVSVSSEQTDDVKAGTVARQRPAAGAQVKPGTVVDISVAMPATVEVPKVVGMARHDAEAALRSLALGFVVSERTSREAPNTVVGLDPPVGTRVKSGHVLNVFVAVADLRTVPELVGKSDVEAMALLRTAELRPMFSKEPTSKYKPGIVLRQEPSAGTRVSPGSEVNVILATSMPRPPSEVPDVTGLPLEEAGAKLWTLASLAVRWDTKESARDRQGVVVSQSPGPGVQVRAGSEVTLTVAVTPNTCIRGYIWREAFPGDRVCVNPQTRVGAVDDNRSAGGRIERDPSKRHSGPDTCVQGLVWREARPGDHVCVVPEVRERTAEDNKTAASRIPRRLGPLPTAR